MISIFRINTYGHCEGGSVGIGVDAEFGLGSEDVIGVEHGTHPSSLDFPPRSCSVSLRATRPARLFAISFFFLTTTTQDIWVEYRSLHIMSDYEDEMDVDTSKDVQFSSDNAAGKKRTVADLPVEAQDNLPW